MKKLILSSIFAFGALLLAADAEAQVMIIANPSVKASEVSKDELRDVFTGAASSLKDGSKVVPVLLEDWGAARRISEVIHREGRYPLTGRDGAAWSFLGRLHPCPRASTATRRW